MNTNAISLARCSFVATCFLLLSAADCAHAQQGLVFPDDKWTRVEPHASGLDRAKLLLAQKYALTGAGAGMIVHGGRLVMSWGDKRRKHDLKSSSKSIGVTALGLAIDDGKMKLSDFATQHHSRFGIPPNANRSKDWLSQITLQHLANQTAGFDKPGGYERLLFAPGTRWHYSDGGPNWLAECVTLAMKQDIQSLMFQRVLTPIGVTKDDLHWRSHAYRDKTIGDYRRYEFGSGVHANVDAMARLGLLYLAHGSWNGKQLISKQFIEQVSEPQKATIGLPEWDDDHGNASEHYGLLWWNNHDGELTGVPKDAFWSWGLHESFIVVIPSLDLVVSRAGADWARKKGEPHYEVLKPFLNPICAAVSPDIASQPQNAPCPQSRFLKGIQWDDKNKIARFADGSDNWPVTWLDDDSLFTAYGDGWGFRPKVKQKLSLGFAKLTGGRLRNQATPIPGIPIQGVNVRSESGERLGQGKDGIKASGLLMVDGVLYMLARNAGNSQLAKSTDRGTTWTWNDWKFTTSFGCPSFVNFGRNYENGPDKMVYIVSPDSETAYRPANQMVLARVDRQRILDRDAYDFFVRTDRNGTPVWSKNIDDRGSIFDHAKRCYRGGITYNAPLKRYLWCQTLPESIHPQGPRFQGGFGVYESPQPWGPWRTVFFTNSWDVGPGESSSMPTKWMSDDGMTIHLLFSGDDAFSVRRGQLYR